MLTKHDWVWIRKTNIECIFSVLLRNQTNSFFRSKLDQASFAVVILCVVHALLTLVEVSLLQIVASIVPVVVTEDEVLFSPIDVEFIVVDDDKWVIEDEVTVDVVVGSNETARVELIVSKLLVQSLQHVREVEDLQHMLWNFHSYIKYIN